MGLLAARRYSSVDKHGIWHCLRTRVARRRCVRSHNMSNLERTSAGLQMVIPGCERRTLPKSTSRVDGAGQRLLGFYKPPSLREKLDLAAKAPLRSSRGQK